MNYKEVYGNLITLAKGGEFDVIVHGCNCFSTMKAGIAVDMAKEFGCDKFLLEKEELKGNINKLGQIQYSKVYINPEDNKVTSHHWHDGRNGIIFYENIGQPYASDSTTGKEIYRKTLAEVYQLDIVNAYTQYNYGKNHVDGVSNPIDYEALTLCMRKINHWFEGKRIGLPKIGAGLAGGDWNRIKNIIQTELKDCNVTVVIFKK